MRRHRVHDIIRPYRQGVALQPSVALDEPLMRAIERMVAGGLREIAVVHHDRPVGIVLLSDAFRRIGLDPPEGRSAGRRVS